MTPRSGLRGEFPGFRQGLVSELTCCGKMPSQKLPPLVNNFPARINAAENKVELVGTNAALGEKSRYICIATQK
jgi:hypothetical protein